MPFLDIAYQGFGDGIAEDGAAVRLFLDAGLDFFVATWFSKSFSLYGERVGALSVVCATKDEADARAEPAEARDPHQLLEPADPRRAVSPTVLATPALRALWEEELAGMRERIKRMRVALRDAGAAGAATTRFITRQRGMFSYSGLSQGADAAPAQRVRRLRGRLRPDLRRRAERSQHRRGRRGDRRSVTEKASARCFTSCTNPSARC